MMPKQYDRIVQSIRKDYTDSDPTPINYNELSASITRTIGDIATTQRQFDIRHKWEGTQVGARCYDAVAKVLYAWTRNPAYGGWSQLFGMQLEHVRGLNKDLATLIQGSEQHLDVLSAKMATTIDTAQTNTARLQHVRESIAPLQEKYEHAKKSISEGDISDPTHYTHLKEHIAQEHLVLNALNELALVSSVRDTELDKIEFLKRHVLFHTGTIHSAKKLAVGAEQICDTLVYLKGIYESVHPIGVCLQGIHEGIGILRGYTDDLHRVYKNTFDTIQGIQHGTNFDILQASTKTLNPLIGELLETYESTRN